MNMEIKWRKAKMKERKSKEKDWKKNEWNDRYKNRQKWPKKLEMKQTNNKTMEIMD